MRSIILAIAILSYFTARSQNDEAKDYLQVANEMEENKLENADIMDVLQESADRGSKQGAYIMGVLYLTGHNLTATDKVKGIKYLEMAATAGLVNAQALLVREYLNGEHVERNDAKAKFWEKQLLNNKELYAPTEPLLGPGQSALNNKLQKAIKEKYSTL